MAGKDSSGGGKEEVVVMRDLAVGVSDPVWGWGSSQRADAGTGIWGLSNQGLGEGLPPGSMLLAASRRKAVDLVDEILRDISLFHRTERKGAHESTSLISFKSLETSQSGPSPRRTGTRFVYM